MNFITENWHMLSLVGFLLVSILNMLTKHYEGHTGAVRWLTFISGLISFLTSKDVETKVLKLPLVPEKKDVK